MMTKNTLKNAQQYTNIWEIKNVKKLKDWQEQTPRHIVIIAKLIALCACIVSMAAIGLKAIFCKSKNTVEAKQPKDFAEKRWSDSDWAMWLQSNKDNWN